MQKPSGGWEQCSMKTSWQYEETEGRMARIGILTCSNATQDLGCSSVSCLSDFRKRKKVFANYPPDEKLTLMGIINCPGCPTLTGPDKLIQGIRALNIHKEEQA
jgi:hypothetical protein